MKLDMYALTDTETGKVIRYEWLGEVGIADCNDYLSKRNAVTRWVIVPEEERKEIERKR